MALPATDNFAGPNNTPLPTYNPNWTELEGSFEVYLSAVRCDGFAMGSFAAGAAWNADEFDDDQYAEATVASLAGGGVSMGLVVRGDADGPSATYYVWYSHPTAGFVDKVVAGSRTTLNPGDATTAWQVDDRVRFTAEGTTLTCYINDVEVKQIVDAAISSGAPGVGCLLSGTPSLDDWEGGNLAGGGGVKTITVTSTVTVTVVDMECE